MEHRITFYPVGNGDTTHRWRAPSSSRSPACWGEGTLRTIDKAELLNDLKKS